MLQSMGLHRGRHDLATEKPPINTYVQFKLCSLVDGDSKGTPLQYFHLENPMDGRA